MPQNVFQLVMLIIWVSLFTHFILWAAQSVRIKVIKEEDMPRVRNRGREELKKELDVDDDTFDWLERTAKKVTGDTVAKWRQKMRHDIASGKSKGAQYYSDHCFTEIAKIALDESKVINRERGEKNG